MSDTIEREWGDGVYRFRLGLGELREIQEKTGTGALLLLRRMATHGWFIDDIREVLRLGLIGAGTEPVKALKLVDRYCEPSKNALLPCVELAVTLLGRAISGPEDDPVGNGEAGKVATESSTSPQSTGPALQ